ncbi:B12-binding domain-containing radical SAM protein [Paramagnetospirillum marisnigri]|uniref:B12-binding domain-containing radical SAM protein n=1 Tax=Paramagnetospirillum marisnigri TaxID=1285242 RepID=A0A178MME0_9PROT|nr:radical SAM protein [Paramagnetospirillum marisnigri]OAN49297.1 B12-binding domain-containing radical SAM protein [Paramagnetospirillum marisnigri]
MTAKNALFLKPPLSGAGARNVVRDFLYGCWCNGRRIGGMQMPPLTELTACTHARQDGVEPVFLDALVEPERFQALIDTRFEGFFAVAVMSSTQSFRQDVETLERVKALNPGIKAILFGSHPTFMPEYCLQETVVDYLVLREPEDTLRELLGALTRGEPVDELAGLALRHPDGSARINEHRAFVTMDNLPIPDRTLLPAGADYFNPVVKRLPYTTMQTSRGCPARCNYCTAPTFYGNKTRVRSAEKVLEEMREIKRLGYREIFFRDETFSAYKGRNFKIFEGMAAEGMDFSWIANARVDMIDEDSMRAMKKAGCHMLKFGVETGSDEMLVTYKKGTTTDQARWAFAKAREVGLDTHAHIIFGGPGESLDTIRQTIAFVKEIRPSTVTFGILTPYPGTEIFDMVAEKQPEILDGSGSNMENLHTSGFFNESLCGLSGDELSRQIVRAYREFYVRPGYLLERLSKIRSFEELMISLVAGANVMQFALTGRK